MIRWPRDALIFSVRVRGHGVYAAGYVEGDTAGGQEILGARATSAGLELVDLHESWLTWERLEALRTLSSQGIPGMARVLDAFVPLTSLQPDSLSSHTAPALVVVEQLPAAVHCGDLVRRLFRGSPSGTPPTGLALRIVRDLAATLLLAQGTPRKDGALRLTRRAENVLLAWDGSVHVQPRLIEVSADDDGGVMECGMHIVQLLTGLLPRAGQDAWERRELADALARRVELLRASVTPSLLTFVLACVEDGPLTDGPRSLETLLEALDRHLLAEPFSRADLAGLLAQLFEQERAEDVAFREDLAACDLDALTLPEVSAVDATRDNIPSRSSA